jgi:hypothetical protein
VDRGRAGVLLGVLFELSDTEQAREICLSFILIRLWEARLWQSRGKASGEVQGQCRQGQLAKYKGDAGKVNWRSTRAMQARSIGEVQGRCRQGQLAKYKGDAGKVNWRSTRAMQARSSEAGEQVKLGKVGWHQGDTKYSCSKAVQNNPAAKWCKY